MELRCNKTTCKHNNSYKCDCREIRISQNCECASFEKCCDCKSDNKCSEGYKMFEVATEMKPYKPLNTKVNCKADCLFNKEGKCIANGISVMDGTKSGVCITNIEP